MMNSYITNNCIKTIAATLLCLLLSCCAGIDGEYLGGLVRVNTDSSVKNTSLPGSGVTFFSWDTVLPAYIYYRSPIITVNMVDRYIELTNPKLWKRVRQDEFKKKTAEVTAREAISNIQHTFNSDTLYVKDITARFGKYDFEHKAFPLTERVFTRVPFTLNNVIISTHTGRRTTPFPNKFEVIINKIVDDKLPIDEIPMPRKVAEQLIKKRKTDLGAVNRLVKVRLWFRVTGLSSHSGHNRFNATLMNVRYIL